jgi:hypothetical protein
MRTPAMVALLVAETTPLIPLVAIAGYATRRQREALACERERSLGAGDVEVGLKHSPNGVAPNQSPPSLFTLTLEDRSATAQPTDH